MTISFGYSVGDFISGFDLLTRLGRFADACINASWDYNQCQLLLDGIYACIRTLDSRGAAGGTEMPSHNGGIRQCQEAASQLEGLIAPYRPYLADGSQALGLRPIAERLRWCFKARPQIENWHQTLPVKLLSVTVNILGNRKAEIQELQASVETLMESMHVLHAGLAECSVMCQARSLRAISFPSVDDASRLSIAQLSIEDNSTFTLVDALGRRETLSVNEFASLSTLHSYLCEAFKHAPGEIKVRQRQYVIRLLGSDAEEVSAATWPAVRRPNTVLVMSIAFFFIHLPPSDCVICSTGSVDYPQDELVPCCSSCRIKYTPVLDVDHNQYVAKPQIYSGFRGTAEDLNTHIEYDVGLPFYHNIDIWLGVALLRFVVQELDCPLHRRSYATSAALAPSSRFLQELHDTDSIAFEIMKALLVAESRTFEKRPFIQQCSHLLKDLPRLQQAFLHLVNIETTLGRYVRLQ